MVVEKIIFGALTYVWMSCWEYLKISLNTFSAVGDLVRSEAGEVKKVEKPEDFTIHDILLPLPGHQV
jgi:hypothetical protein